MNLANFLVILSFCAFLEASARAPISGKRLQMITGLNKPKTTQDHWDSIYNTNDFVYGKKPSQFLVDNSHYIPYGGKVLDVGMGEGRHAVYLAQKGYDVTGVDISSIAVKKAFKLARERGVKIKAVVSSMEKFKAPEKSFDAIVCFYYVDRRLIHKLKKLLKPGGVLLFEANTISEKLLNKKLTLDPDSYFLKSGELLGMFPQTRILKYEEPLHEKSYRASVIVQKPKKAL